MPVGASGGAHLPLRGGAAREARGDCPLQIWTGARCVLVWRGFGAVALQKAQPMSVECTLVPHRMKGPDMQPWSTCGDVLRIHLHTVLTLPQSRFCAQGRPPPHARGRSHHLDAIWGAVGGFRHKGRYIRPLESQACPTSSAGAA